VYHDSLNPPSATATWATRTVGELSRSAAATCRSDATVAAVLGALPKRAVDAVFVVDADGRLEAALDPRRLLADVERRRVDGAAQISQLAEVVPAFLTPEMSLPAALDVFLRERAHVLPLVSGAWHPVLLGEVSRTDLALALQEQLSGSQDAAR
jgi:CBS domain-containing protein